MLAGGVYALVAETPPARFPILSVSLAHALDAGVNCTVVVPGQPGLFAERVRSFCDLDLHALIDAGKLSLFEMQDEFPKKMFRFGAESFVRELEHFGVADGGYLIFDQADELLALHDVSLALDQIEALRKWFVERGITVLLVFSRVTPAQSGTLTALMDNLAGLVRLGADRNGLGLSFDYWQSPEGTIAARNFVLNRTADGLYDAINASAAPAQGAGALDNDVAPAPQEDNTHFFFMDPDLGSLAQQLPGVWQRVDTLVGMMHATRSRPAATIILTFYRDTRLRQLAEAVHTLRLTLGRYARIVVQEKNTSLRYQNEALLLRLGVNMVVHRDVAPSRLPLLLESLRGQVFSRDVNINFEAAIASVLPSRLKGYLTPARFVREARIVMERADTLAIPYALVTGKPAGGRSLADTITGSTLSRAGDLVTADQTRCLLFLNGCPQAVLLATVQRILGMPVEQALDDVQFLVNPADVEAELAALVRAAERSDIPDFSALLPEDVASDEPPPAEETKGALSDSLPPAINTLANARPAPAHVASMRPAPDRAASAAPAPAAAPQPAKPSPQQPASGKENQSRPDETAFRKREVPRATRRMSADTASAAPREDALNPAQT